MKLADADLLKLVPWHIAEDRSFEAAGTALRPYLSRLSRSIPNLLIYSRLGNADPKRFLPPLRRLTEAAGGLAELSQEILEKLAWQFHVDFREAARTRQELAAMVRNSIAWHRIKGTPASIKAALSLFNYTNVRTQDASGRAAGAQQTPRSLQATARSGAGTRRAGGIYIDEHDRGMHWASYQLGFDEVASLDDLKIILKICQEMQPARCRLWRVYTSDYDFRPGVWSGKLPTYAWSQCWWSSYSGTYFPELPGLDDRGLLVSFGLRRRFLCEQYALGLGLGRSDVFCGRIPLFRYPVWSAAYWGEVFPRALPFAVAAVIPLHGCEYIFEPELPWYQAPWQNWPWAKSHRWDRRHPQFSAFFTDIPFAQECWSDAVNKGNRHQWFHDVWPEKAWLKSRWPRKVCKSAGWSAENSFWGAREILISAPAPKWGEFHWADNIDPPIYKRIDEFFYDYDAWLHVPALPENPEVFTARSELQPFLLCGWSNMAWPDAPWQENILAFGSQHFAGHTETFLANPWPDAVWPSASWRTDQICHAAIAHWRGMGWQVKELDPANPLAGQMSLLGSRVPRRFWPDGPWQDHDWQDAETTGQEQIFAEKITIKLQNGKIADTGIFSEKISLNLPNSFPLSQCGSVAAKVAERAQWPDTAWPQGPWPKPPCVSASQTCSQIFPACREPCLHAAVQIQTLATGKIDPDCNFAPGSLFPALAGNGPRFTAWQDGAWPGHAWDKILGCQRAQAPFTINVKSEFLEV